ncbi:DUF4915 domain-containing protein [Peribacillus sp. SCS-155]|uniref:DUF4915 domain-containing protein n=1 Tax=Peribacillus sedimenti TaxID=3115297 RepID=UPI003905D232
MEKIFIDHTTMQSLQKIDFEYSSLNQVTTYSVSGHKTSYCEDLLITVGRGNGGLYLYNAGNNSLEKRYNGIFAGLTKYNDGYLALKQPNQLYVLDVNLQLKSIRYIPDNEFGGLHDIKLSGDYVYIVISTQNKILALHSRTLEPEFEIVLSSSERDLHHINDLFITDDSILISMFSSSGGWKGKDPTLWDGAIVEFRRDGFIPKGIIIDNLTAPHSITLHNGKLVFCDSLNLNVSQFDIITKHKSVLAQFNGFTRGIYFDQNILAVGQCKMRHLQRMNQRYPNISLDGGIHFFDCDQRDGRFIKLPVSNPYAIVPYTIT